MAVTERTWTVASRGTGQPDYTREISLGRERPGLTLKHKERLLGFTRTFTNIPSPYAFVTTPLAVGATASLIDAETGLAMPYSSQAGYVFSVLSTSYSFNQDAAIWTYLEGALWATAGMPASGQVFYIAEVIGVSTAFFDPEGLIAHIVDFQVVNEGAAEMEGGFTTFVTLEEVGTEPLPTTKTVKCKFCGYEETVSRETTKWICPKCKKLNLYYNLSKFRGAV